LSKADQLKALREARYLANQRTASPSKSVKRRLSRTEDGEVETAAVGGSQPDGARLCGHMSISKKPCIRAKDHPEKNHRYAKS
jgi:hypothetical protein